MNKKYAAFRTSVHAEHDHCSKCGGKKYKGDLVHLPAGLVACEECLEENPVGRWTDEAGEYPE